MSNPASKGDLGSGRPGSLLWHKSWIYSCATTKELEDYTFSVFKRKLKIPKNLSLEKAQMGVWGLFKRELAND